MIVVCVCPQTPHIGVGAGACNNVNARSPRALLHERPGAHSSSLWHILHTVWPGAPGCMSVAWVWRILDRRFNRLDLRLWCPFIRDAAMVAYCLSRVSVHTGSCSRRHVAVLDHMVRTSCQCHAPPVHKTPHPHHAPQVAHPCLDLYDCMLMQCSAY